LLDHKLRPPESLVVDSLVELAPVRLNHLIAFRLQRWLRKLGKLVVQRAARLLLHHSRQGMPSAHHSSTNACPDAAAHAATHAAAHGAANAGASIWAS